MLSILKKQELVRSEGTGGERHDSVAYLWTVGSRQCMFFRLKKYEMPSVIHAVLGREGLW